MQFKHPEILYALLLLIIPIIVHLFQLQKFTRVPFTNVKILREIQQENRKSAKLKKWLVLASRLVAFACLIIAFAQPYFSKYNTATSFKTTIYLDNSLSMQAKGSNGELLKSSAQNIIENLENSNQEIQFVTNNQRIKKTTINNFKNNLKKIDYTTKSASLSSILLQINASNKAEENTSQKNIFISDFQNYTTLENDLNTIKTPTYLIEVKPQSYNNIFIDSVFVSNKMNNEITLNVVVKNNIPNKNSAPISLYNNDVLIGKSTVNFNTNPQEIVQFSIPNTTEFNGKLSIVDENLSFDNQFYFSLNKPLKPSILCIGKNSPFLSKIYRSNQFDYQNFQLQNLNYNKILNSEVIILNELNTIPTALVQQLQKFFETGGRIGVVPSKNIDFNSYNSLFKALNIGQLKQIVSEEHKITFINYDHPIFKNVFEKEVYNFEFPSTNFYYETDFSNNNSIVKLDNNQAFISSYKTSTSNFLWIASPLDLETSNFTNSPLIVPIFFNFATNNKRLENLFIKIAPTNIIEVKTTIGKDDVLTVSNNVNSFIPKQQQLKNKVILTIEDQINKAGIYTIYNKNEALKTIAFNYNTSESRLLPVDLTRIENTNSKINVSNSINEILTEISNEQKINTLFKWFLAFSALFLCIEMLILKYFKI